MHRLLILSLVALAAASAVAQETIQGPVKLQGAEVIARIDNSVILASDVLWEAELIIQVSNVPPEQVEEARHMLTQKQLKSYIDTKLIMADFRRTARGADMDAIRGQLEEPFYSGGMSGKSPGSVPGLMEVLKVDDLEELDKKLVSLGTSLADRKEAFMEKAIAQTWVHEQIDVPKPTYADLLEYYKTHQEDYAIAKAARWEELMVEFKNHPTREAARAKIAEAGNIVWQRAQAQPDASKPLFTDVAPKYSESYKAVDGGLYDWTSEGALRDPNLNTALFTLPVGSLSPILESEVGYHIIRVVERREAGYQPFEELQDAIREKIMNDSFGEQTQKLIDKLRGEARIWTIYSGDTTAQAYIESPLVPPSRVR